MCGGHELVGYLITEDSENAQCTFSACVVLRHTGPPLEKNCQIGGKNYSKNRVKIKVTHRAGCMGRVKPDGLQGQRSCHGIFGKLVWKVGTTATFPIDIISKNQKLSFD